MTARRHLLASSLLTLAVAMALAGCGDGRSEATTVSAGSPVGVGTAMAPASLARQMAAGTTTTTVDPRASAEDKAVAGAKTKIRALRGRYPFPDDATDCVAAEVADRAEVLAQMDKAVDSGPIPNAVLNAGARCMREIHAGPAFVRELARDAKGGLTGKQKVCALKGYLALDEQQVADATAASLNPDAAKGDPKAGINAVNEMVSACGIEVTR